MITFFNKFGNSWVAKIICGILGVSMMAFWGLGGISLSSGIDNTAITVGRQKVSIQQINKAFEAQKNQLSQITGTYISPKQAIENGLLDQVIQEQTMQLVQDKIKNDIGLTASDEAVRKYVENNPVFHDSLGHFDANVFYTYLNQTKMSQEQLSQKMKDELSMQHLTNALLKSVPREKKIMISAVQAQKEQRQISYYLLNQSDIVVGTPNEADLKDYYEAYQEQFVSPEYRKIRLLSITADHFKGDKEKSYDKMYQSIRDLEDLLGSGTPLVEASKKLNLPSPVEITSDFNGKNRQGTLAEKNLKENPILQEIFVLDEKEATSITEQGNGFLVAEVEEIIPSTFIPFTQVKEKVARLYKQEQQKEKLPEITESIKQNLVQQKGWGKYHPQTTIVSRKQAPKEIQPYLSDIFIQNSGNKNAQSFATPNGQLILVIDKVISNTKQPSDTEKQEAIQLWAQDLIQAVQQNSTKDLKIKIHHEAIKKAFATYLKEED